jgi:XTP/dITP diphosphohydrolase
VKPRLLLATNNVGKIEEFTALLAELVGLELINPADLGLDLEIPEDGKDYAENAAIKARAFMEASGLPSLADDSGIEVDVLGGLPGLHSARVAPTAAERRRLLLGQLAGKPRPWKARFHSTVCLAMPHGELYFAEGQCLGEIATEESGSGGFGYDPIFIVEGGTRTMAELSAAEKNQLSHRARAMQEMKQILAMSLFL